MKHIIQGDYFDGKDSVSMFELTKLVNSHLKKG